MGDVVGHPAVAREAEFVNLLQSGEESWEEIVEFIRDDRNAMARRLYMLRHLDELTGDVQDDYSEDDIEDFMHNQGELSPEEAEEIARDLKFPPYHLSPVEEEYDDEDEELPTGEYEICQRCGGAGCLECEQGLSDITGLHKEMNLDDFLK